MIVINKDDLKKYIKLRKKLDSLDGTISRLEAEITTAKTPKLSDMPKSNRLVDPTDKIVKLVDMRTYYNQIWDECIDRMREIETVIEQLEDPTENALMRQRYINGLSWEEICLELNYSWRQTHNIHSKALKSIAENAQNQRCEVFTGKTTN